MVRHSFRFAFTFIELIFAIVIIGISVMTLPTITQVLNTGLEKNMAQEAILLASADVVKALSGEWDDNSRVGNLNYEYTLYASDAELTAMDNNSTRLGYINILYHPDKTIRPTMTVDGNDDIDDFSTAGVVQDAVTNIASAQSFKNKYKKEIAVTQNETFAGINQGTNIKKVVVTIKKSDNSNISQLYLYAFNTGSASSPSRRLQ